MDLLMDERASTDIYSHRLAWQMVRFLHNLKTILNGHENHSSLQGN